jgi:stage II sporulation protein AA (anti-sigma F factor antagonist)
LKQASGSPSGSIFESNRRRPTLDDDRASTLANRCSMRIEHGFGVCVIRLYGEFDLFCERAFHEELEATLDDRVETLVMDLRGLEFMDSSGLLMLVEIDNLSSQKGFELSVLCGHGLVRQLLRETGLDGILPLVDASGTVPASESPV